MSVAKILPGKYLYLHVFLMLRSLCNDGYINNTHSRILILQVSNAISGSENGSKIRVYLLISDTSRVCECTVVMGENLY